MIPAAKYIDGAFFTPKDIGVSLDSFPFSRNGDLTTCDYTRAYQIHRRFYSRAADGSEDPLRSGFFLLTETTPEIGEGDIATFKRTYSNVPITQVEESSTNITRPEIPGTGNPRTFLSYLVYQPDANSPVFHVYTKRAVTVDSGLSIAVTGGTYTLTFGANTTTAQAFNATAATIKTALNGLASMAAFGSVDVTGAYNTGFTVVFSAYATASANMASITGSTGSSNSSAYIAPTILGTVQYVNLRRTGIDAGSPSANGSGLSSGNYAAFNQAGDVFVVTIGTSGPFGVSGNFTLTVYGETTPAIGFTNDATAMQGVLLFYLSALTNLPARGALNVSIQSISPYGMVAHVEVYPHITGGTYTLTALGQTTAAIAYNASLAAIAAALNLLSNVTAVGGVSATGNGYYTNGNGQLSIDFSIIFADRPSFSPNPASLTPSPCLITVAPTAQGTVQTLVFSSANTDRTLTFSAGHGATAGEALYFNRGGTYFYDITAWTFINDNQIRVNAANVPFNNAALFTEVGRKTREYSPGSKWVPVDLVTEYELPGVSDPVPVPEYQGDVVPFLTAVFANEGSLNWRIAEPARFKDSIIRAYTRTTIEVSKI